ncbi:MAG: siphovirus Gp157 family protein [Ruminococcus sp.]|nr:siphovirus Gp157 family protein [Ruminococcus sp.]
MAALYEIAGDYRRLFDSLEEMEENAGGLTEEIGQAWFDTLEGMEDELTEKAENIVKYIKNLSAEAEALKGEKKRLESRRRAKEKRAESLKKYLINCMETAGYRKLETVSGAVSVRDSPESVELTDENAFIGWAELHDREEFLRYHAPEVNKSAVKAALNGGENIPGVRLARNKNLVIR